MKTFWVTVLLLTSTGRVFSQDYSVTFHVTSVEQGEAPDYCTTGECSATKFTVEGYTQNKDSGVQYVLECVEVIAWDSTHHSVTCARLHSHADYDARIYSHTVAFGRRSSSHEDPIKIDYSIKSEREIKSQKK